MLQKGNRDFLFVEFFSMGFIISTDLFNFLLDQFEHMQDELDRRREECIQLRTVLANASLEEQPFSLLSRASELPDAEELFTAYETQKSVISQLQEQLSDEKSRAKETEAEMRGELEKLGKTCSEQQMVINQTINKGPANNTEACLQHEISRLTGENFDLREKIEEISSSNKRLKKQLKLYMKRLNEVGAALPDVGAADGGGGAGGNEVETRQQLNSESNLPVIRKKEHDFLGMFKYEKEREPQVLKALIYGTNIFNVY